MLNTLAIVGVGLLGGSIALAARERKLAHRIIGISRHPETLQIAQQRGMIDVGSVEWNEELSEAQLAIVCTPVDTIAELSLKLLRQYPQLIVTDVGSTKETILEAISREPKLAERFIGGHPLAGSEKSGPEHAMADLFQDRLLFITPSATSTAAATELVTRFWQTLGSQTIAMEAKKHDAIMAMISHMPCLASFALAGAIPAEYLQYSGTGLRSMCRLAGGDATMWSAIVRENRMHLLESIGKLQDGLMDLKQAIMAGDDVALQRLLEAGRRTYHALGS
jgi:prephenate dehydrogenase